MQGESGRLRRGLDEEVEKEEGDAEEKKEGAEGEAAAGELCDGMEEAHRDDPEPGFAPAEIERADGDVTGKVAAEKGKFAVKPDGEVSAIAPEVEGAQNEYRIAENGQNTESGTVTPIQHKTLTAGTEALRTKPHRAPKGSETV